MNRRSALLGLLGIPAVPVAAASHEHKLPTHRTTAVNVECRLCGSLMMIVLVESSTGSDVFECHCSPGSYVRAFRAEVRSEAALDAETVLAIARRQENSRISQKENELRYQLWKMKS